MGHKNEKTLITVVVPVYKVEKYIKKCVDSILCQNYSNLEVILVDDGSPDHCGMICDEYKEQDARIRVIHQENKGLSSARNSAINIARGKYITFVDSDDYIESDMIEVLYNQICLYKADMAVTSLECFYENGSTKSNKHGKQVIAYKKEEAMDCFLFNGYLTPCVCGKLYSMDLWKTVRCPEGKLFEDQFTTYKIIDLCEKIIFVTKPMYHYRKRKGSIGHAPFSKQTYDLYDGIQEEYSFISKKYAEMCPNIAVAKIIWEIVFVNMMILSGYFDCEVVREVQSFIRKYLIEVRKCKYISRVRKMQILLFLNSYSTYRKFYLGYKKIHPIS